MELPSEPDVLAKLVAWGEANDAVRALILTSTRARPGGGADILSDYDVIVAVPDAPAFANDTSWARDYGEPLAGWGDESSVHGLTTYFRGLVYRDGVRIDYTIWPEELLDRVAATPKLPDDLDVGYRVLLDKDGRTTGWSPPTYRAHIPARPRREEYQAAVEEFWWSATYVAKALWRRELFFAKYIFEYDVKGIALRRLLEWRIELDHDWSLKPGAYGRGLEQLVPADVWSELATTYVGVDPDECWAALFRTTAVFRRVAKDVADALGYPYPQDADEGVSAFLEGVRQLSR